jgi:hypothetical protein
MSAKVSKKDEDYKDFKNYFVPLLPNISLLQNATL